MTYEVQSCYSQGFSPAFVTFTYDDAHLPRDGSLHMSELQSLRKRMYRALEYHNIPQPRQGFKYLLVGEYGDQFGRCHMHGVFPSVGSAYPEFFGSVWKNGSIKVLPLLRGGIRYCLKYMDKHQKEYDELYTKNGLEPPMRAHSSKLGYEYYRDHAREIHEREGLLNNGRIVYFDYYERKQFNVGSSPQDWSLLRSQAHERNMSLGEYMRKDAWLKEYVQIAKMRENGESVDASHLWQSKNQPNDWFNYVDRTYDADYKPVQSSASYEVLRELFETEETL